jgi:hypothetical protein
MFHVAQRSSQKLCINETTDPLSTYKTTMTDLIVDFPQQRNHNYFQHNTMPNLIVDFPQQRKRKQRQRVVRFANTAQLRVVKRHEDTVVRHELWYTKLEYDLMTLAIERDVLQVRLQALAGAAGKKDDASPEENNVCCIGIEKLLTPAWTFEVKACRARCRHAVLAEQAKQEQDPSAKFSWGAIALASSAQTWEAVLRARELGKLHWDASERSC